MRQLKNFLIKREQSQARLSFAKREKSRLLAKTLLTLVALLAVTTGAWAADGIVCTASDLGKVLCTDGSIYENVSAATTAGKTAAAVIAYVDETNKNGLALALTDEDGQTWDNSSPSNKGKTAPEICSALNTSKAVTGGTWKLPSQDEWKQMFSANGGNEESYTGLKTAIGNAGGTALVENEDYWSSSEVDDYDAWLVNLADGNASWDTYGKHYSRCIRACLAFDIAASSGPEVAWDKAEKSGSFTMPGGNVTLEPEYYPQAALTAAPTAINDVPATTDGAIVNAGTVANIGETTTAQGTVMYYVSQTALDDDALLALAADQWTADVPTAADFAQGQAYIYYYVRGNDSDNDEENFSDGDILAANALTVTIAAEPTYAVTFADDTAEPNEWNADPNTGVKKGQTVTVTYTGTKKVIGVKVEKKSEAVENAYQKWNADQKKLVATEIPTTAIKVEDASTDVNWQGTYVVDGEVTINGKITLNGDVNLIIKDGAKLTAKQISGNSKNLSIYGQAQMTGELVVDNSGDDAITNITILEVHSAKVKATASSSDPYFLCGGFYIEKFNVYGGLVDAKGTAEVVGYGICLKEGGSLNIYGGEVKAEGKGEDETWCCGILCENIATVTVNGGKLWSGNADKRAINAVNLQKGAGFTGKIETSADNSAWAEYTGDATPTTKYVRVGY